MSIDMNTMNTKFMKACKMGDMDEIILATENGVNDWATGLYHACEHNFTEIVEFFVSKTDKLEDLNKGLVGACLGGYIKMIDIVVAHGANDWNSGLSAACEGGRLEVAKIMIQRGASNFDEGLYNACLGKYSNGYPHLVLAEFMANQDVKISDINKCLKYACVGGYEELAKIMVAKGAKNFDEGLRQACASKNINIVKLMLDCGATNVDESLTGLIKYHNDKPNNKADAIIRLLVTRGAKYGEFKLFEDSNNCYFKNRH